METWLPKCFWSAEKLFAPRTYSQASGSLPAYTNRDWLFWLRRCCCVKQRSCWWLKHSSLSIKDNVLCTMKLPDSTTRTARPDVCFEEVETLLVWNGDNSLYFPFFSCLGNQSGTLWNESSLDRAPLWVSWDIFNRKGHLKILTDALNRRKYYRPINFLSVLESKEMADITRKAYDKEDLFRISMHSFKIAVIKELVHLDPRSKLFHFIREEERGLRTPRSPEFIHFIMHELHDVPFAAHSGFKKVNKDIWKLLYWPKMKKDMESTSKGLLSTTSLIAMSEYPWESISLDLITNLPKSQGYTQFS